MLKVFGSRQAGKTIELIKVSAEKQIPILTIDNGSCQLIKTLAKYLGIDNLPEPISYLAMHPFREKQPVLVDDAQEIFKALLKDKNLELKGMAINTHDSISKSDAISQRFLYVIDE